jgi:hypothetical protein
MLATKGHKKKKIQIQNHNRHNRTQKQKKKEHNRKIPGGIVKILTQQDN